MIRIFYVILISTVLAGCPATFNGLIKNELANEIFVIPPFENEYRWVIESGGEEKVNWYQECITIKGPDGVLYFSGWPIPDNVVTNGIFSSSHEVVYRNRELFFKSKEGQLIKIDRVATCTKA